MMLLDERSTLILSQFINSSSFIPINEITEKLHISKRTVYYDIEKIDYWLKEQGFPPVQYVRGMGFYVTEETKKQVSSIIQVVRRSQYYYSDQERKALLAIYLLSGTKGLFLKELAEKIGVSRGTTNTVLNKVKEELHNFQLWVSFHRKHGYLIEGDESNKRKALVHYLSQVLSKQGWKTLLTEIHQLLDMKLSKPLSLQDPMTPMLQEEQVSFVYQKIDKLVQEVGRHITDEMLLQLSVRLIIFSKRFKHGRRVTMDEDEKNILQSTPEYKAAKKISVELESMFCTEFPEDEICYITMNLLAAKVNYFNPDLRNPEDDMTHLKAIIRKMVDDFQKYACVFFRHRDEFEQKMLIHIKPAYYRIKYGLEIENPLIETIQDKYKEIFEITKKVMHYFEDFIGKTVSEKEIAYIAMHFGGWMKREGTNMMHRKKAMIVCGNGISTSRILQGQLESLFSTIDIVSTVSLREYESQEFEVDFIFSTAPIQKKHLPVFIVSPILTDTEKEKLLSQVNHLVQKKNRKTHSPSVKTLLDIIKKHANILDERRLSDELSEYFSAERQWIKENRKPMLNELLTNEMIQFKTEIKQWPDAIRIAAEPLLKQGFIKPQYVTSMIQNVEELGPYIVLAPKIAIPHSRPEFGVNQLGMSLLCLENPVAFSDDPKHQVHLVIVLAAIDNETHLKALSQLSALLGNEDNINKILNTKSKNQILTLINQYSSN
ncbi:BglG family transcription antiterminator [Aneurinibacillus sp. Ricciae_BoGa-3]|uniref:BglG family transcription antiterminator n=1 Tax=Aneurinibacillus sp. Ricciae_BoGa-3 TaxID=3022697 RepID=UPI00234264C1|nr:BglG family transcription antiterminator [Aneurinibacillus sp. Ricciae_BoGa-3]WCK55037.1 BglG family transcription antiterminator [Aneurinibacillus sp. Ricciae_BoGa-3]